MQLIADCFSSNDEINHGFKIKGRLEAEDFSLIIDVTYDILERLWLFVGSFVNPPRVSGKLSSKKSSIRQVKTFPHIPHAKSKQQVGKDQEAEDKKSPDILENSAKKPCLQSIEKPASHCKTPNDTILC